MLSKGVTIYTTIYITERIICNYQLFPFFPFSNCQIFPLTSWPLEPLNHLPLYPFTPLPSPFTWSLELFIITYNVFLKKSIKITQSPIVPRVRGGDPSGVAPGKVEDNNSGPGHPRKLISWKLGRCIHHLCMGGLSASSDVWKMSRIIHHLSMILYFIPLGDFLIRLDSEIFSFPSCFFSYIYLNRLRDFSLIISAVNFTTDQEDGQFWTTSWHSRKINYPWFKRGRIQLSYFLDPKLIWCSSSKNQE